MYNKIGEVLCAQFPKELVNAFLQSYEKSMAEYKKQDLQSLAQQLSNYCDNTVRLIEFKIHGAYTPFLSKIPAIDENLLCVLQENKQNISATYKIILPRSIYLMQGVLYQRGMNLANVPPSEEIDTNFLLNSAKFIMAELIRVCASSKNGIEQELIKNVTEKESTIIWNTGKNIRVLNPKMQCKEKVLCILYIKDGQTTSDLLLASEYPNETVFRLYLKELHENKMIEYVNDKCYLSPKGKISAEELMK